MATLKRRTKQTKNKQTRRLCQCKYVILGVVNMSFIHTKYMVIIMLFAFAKKKPKKQNKTKQNKLLNGNS